MCAFGALIKEPLLSAHEILNVHPSLLPRWRGAAPIERAIMAGDEQTGVSIMRLTAGLDSGPRVPHGRASRSVPQDTYGSLAARLQELGGELLLRALTRSEASARSSSRPSAASPTRRRSTPATACSTRRARRSSSSASCARCTRTSARAWRSPTGRCSACTRRATRARARARRTRRARARRDRTRRSPAARLRRGALELLVVQPPGGRAMDGRRLPARSRARRPPVGGERRPAARCRRAAAGRAAARPARCASGITPAHAGSA